MTAGLQYDCNTQRFSAEAEGGTFLILTEEELKERNRLLVLENDELLAVNSKVKTYLEWAKYYLERDAYLPAETAINQALEELK